MRSSPVCTTVCDGPGNDVGYNDSEYLILVNTGSAEVSVAGWTIPMGIPR